MANPQDNKIGAGGFVYLPLIAGWLVPGAGHFLLRKWGRGALLSVSILGMFSIGIAMQGKLYAGAHDILDMLGLAGDLGNGLLYVVSRAAGWARTRSPSPPATTAPASSSWPACST
jgi:TM2 domain-containing membrane protein YozV